MCQMASFLLIIAFYDNKNTARFLNSILLPQFKMASKKSEPSVSSKEVESEIAVLAGEQPSSKGDLNSMFKEFMKRQDSMASSSQQTNETLLLAMNKVLSSVTPQPLGKVVVLPSQENPRSQPNLFSPSELAAEADVEGDGDGDWVVMRVETHWVLISFYDKSVILH